MTETRLILTSGILLVAGLSLFVVPKVTHLIHATKQSVQQPLELEK